MKQLIKKILREETDKQLQIKQQLEKHIEDFGIESTINSFNRDYRFLAKKLQLTPQEFINKYLLNMPSSLWDLNKFVSLDSTLIDEYMKQTKGSTLISNDGEATKPYEVFPFIVTKNKKYENCELSYIGMAGSIEWVCEWQKQDKFYETISYATPYYADNTTWVSLEFINETEVFNFDDSSIAFENPYQFKSAQEFEEWFKSTYLPKSFELTKQIFDKILPQIESEL